MNPTPNFILVLAIVLIIACMHLPLAAIIPIALLFIVALGLFWANWNYDNVMTDDFEMPEEKDLPANLRKQAK